MFGGQQLVSILCSIVRTKLVALWIGPAGIGLFGIFNSAVETIGGLSQLNLRQTAVREMAAAHPSEIGIVARSVRRIAFWLGVLGAVVMLCLSPWLAESSLGDSRGWTSFAWLAVTIVLIAVNNGEAAVFQGFQRFHRLTVCMMAGALGGLAVSVPMFYFWRIDSIVPSIIAFYVVTWLALGFYRQKLPQADRTLGVRQTFAFGRRFLQLGVFLTMSELAVNAINYVFLAYLSRTAGIDTAGIYNAGFTLTTRYAGLVFAAIAMEYFPRLASVARRSRLESVFVSNQALIALAILVPIATAFVGLLPFVVRLLYSEAFVAVIPMAAIAMVGTALRAVAWCMGFVIVARGDGMVFLITETLSAAIALTLNIVGYNFAGFAGLGVAYTLWYAIYTAIVAFVYFGRYSLSLNRIVWGRLLYAVLLIAVSAGLALWVSAWWCIVPAIVSWIVAVRQLRFS